MKQQSNDAKSYGGPGKDAEEHSHADDPIKGGNSNWNEKRDKGTNEEKEMKRIRGERKSIKEAQKNRHRPLL